MKSNITVVRRVLEANETDAAQNRARADEHQVRVVNITSAAGSGKTMLLQRSLPMLIARGTRPAVIVGDLQTSRDAERLGETGCPIVQINTEGGCHLSACQIARAMDDLDLDRIDLLFIENVGNMVCPSGFDLGEHARVAMLSTTEGDDKAAKYNTLFQPADLIVINKMDLAEVVDYDVSRVYVDLDKINTRAARLEVSAKTGQGMAEWIDDLLRL